MADDRWPMTDGRWPMRWAMTDGRWPMADGRWAMTDGRTAGGTRIAQPQGDDVCISGLRANCATSALNQSETRRRKVNAMNGMKNYKQLDAWKLAMSMADTTYDLTDTFPDRERYGLTAQLRKSAVSVPSNIAEGQARGTARFGLFFIRVALGSVAELDTQMEIARRRKYVTVEGTRDLDHQLERVRQTLYGMRREHERRLGAAGGAVVLLFLVCWVTGLF